MAKIDLDVLFASAMPKKQSKRQRSWWQLEAPPEGFVFAHDVVRSVFGTAYVPFGIVVAALGSLFGRDSVEVVDVSDRRVLVKSLDARGSLVRPDADAQGSMLAIKKTLVRDFEVELMSANESLGSGLSIDSSWKKSKRK